MYEIEFYFCLATQKAGFSDGSINPDTGIGLYKSGRLFSYLEATPESDVDLLISTGVGARMAQAVSGLKFYGYLSGRDPVLRVALHKKVDVLNIIDWGIEGVHYERVKGTNTLITYPEGVTSENDGYGLNQGWSFGTADG